MNRKDIKHISSRHYRKLQKHVESMAGSKPSEAIHQFRVEYKKLRAFFRSLSTLRSTPVKVVMPSKLKKMYAVCGEIRDLELQQQRIKELAGENKKAAADYLKTLQGVIDGLKPRLKKMTSKKIIAGSKVKTDKLLPVVFSQDDLTHYIRRQEEGITTTIHHPRLNDDHFHAVRKYFKDIFYTGKQYKDQGYKFPGNGIDDDQAETAVSALLDRLGDFQDQHVLIACLDKYWLNRFKLATHQFLAAVQEDLLKEHQQSRRLLKKEIMNYSRKFSESLNNSSPDVVS